MIGALVEQPRNEWKEIICVSRRAAQLDVEDDPIHLISIDILSASVDDIVCELSKVGGEAIKHVYHYTYIEKQDEKESDEVNKLLLQKALDASVNITEKQIECFTLQTGYKVRHLFKQLHTRMAL
jgi:hypothetical protein